MVGLLLGAPATGHRAEASPAAVENPAREEALTTIRLSVEAEARLGIATASVERRPLPQTRRLGGEVVVPPRHYARPASDNAQSVFAILPLLTPPELMRIAEAQIDADGQVERARVELDATRNALHRAKRLLGEKAGSARAVDEARTQAAMAEGALRTAQARRALLGGPVLAVRPPSEVWIRVAIYVGDLSTLDTQQTAHVASLSAAPDAPGHAVTAVSGPPSANPSAATVDLFYALANDDGGFRPGEKVSVRIALQQLQDTLVLPWASIVHDINGDAWVYERIAPQTYARRRVMVAALIGEQAALASGPSPGATVVTDGAAELFGTEFGAGH